MVWVLVQIPALISYASLSGSWQETVGICKRGNEGSFFNENIRNGGELGTSNSRDTATTPISAGAKQGSEYQKLKRFLAIAEDRTSWQDRGTHVNNNPTGKSKQNKISESLSFAVFYFLAMACHLHN